MSDTKTLLVNPFEQIINWHNEETPVQIRLEEFLPVLYILFWDNNHYVSYLPYLMPASMKKDEYTYFCTTFLPKYAYDYMYILCNKDNKPRSWISRADISIHVLDKKNEEKFIKGVDALRNLKKFIEECTFKYDFDFGYYEVGTGNKSLIENMTEKVTGWANQWRNTNKNQKARDYVKNKQHRERLFAKIQGTENIIAEINKATLSTLSGVINTNQLREISHLPQYENSSNKNIIDIFQALVGKASTCVYDKNITHNEYKICQTLSNDIKEIYDNLQGNLKGVGPSVSEDTIGILKKMDDQALQSAQNNNEVSTDVGIKIKEAIMHLTNNNEGMAVYEGYFWSSNILKKANNKIYYITFIGDQIILHNISDNKKHTKTEGKFNIEKVYTSDDEESIDFKLMGDGSIQIKGSNQWMYAEYKRVPIIETLVIAANDNDTKMEREEDFTLIITKQNLTEYLQKNTFYAVKQYETLKHCTEDGHEHFFTDKSLYLIKDFHTSLRVDDLLNNEKRLGSMKTDYFEHFLPCFNEFWLDFLDQKEDQHLFLHVKDLKYKIHPARLEDTVRKTWPVYLAYMKGFLRREIPPSFGSSNIDTMDTDSDLHTLTAFGKCPPITETIRTKNDICGYIFRSIDNRINRDLCKQASVRDVPEFQQNEIIEVVNKIRETETKSNDKDWGIKSLININPIHDTLKLFQHTGGHEESKQIADLDGYNLDYKVISSLVHNIIVVMENIMYFQEIQKDHSDYIRKIENNSHDDKEFSYWFYKTNKVPKLELLFFYKYHHIENSIAETKSPESLKLPVTDFEDFECHSITEEKQTRPLILYNSFSSSEPIQKIDQIGQIKSNLFDFKDEMVVHIGKKNFSKLLRMLAENLICARGIDADTKDAVEKIYIHNMKELISVVEARISERVFLQEDIMAFEKIKKEEDNNAQRFKKLMIRHEKIRRKMVMGEYATYIYGLYKSHLENLTVESLNTLITKYTRYNEIDVKHKTDKDAGEESNTKRNIFKEVTLSDDSDTLKTKIKNIFQTIEPQDSTFKPLLTQINEINNEEEKGYLLHALYRTVEVVLGNNEKIEENKHDEKKDEDKKEKEKHLMSLQDQFRTLYQRHIDEPSLDTLRILLKIYIEFNDKYKAAEVNDTMIEHRHENLFPKNITLVASNVLKDKIKNDLDRLDVQQKQEFIKLSANIEEQKNNDASFDEENKYLLYALYKTLPPNERPVPDAPDDDTRNAEAETNNTDEAAAAKKATLKRRLNLAQQGMKEFIKNSQDNKETKEEFDDLIRGFTELKTSINKANDIEVLRQLETRIDNLTEQSLTKQNEITEKREKQNEIERETPKNDEPKRDETKRKVLRPRAPGRPSHIVDNDAEYTKTKERRATRASTQGDKRFRQKSRTVHLPSSDSSSESTYTSDSSLSPVLKKRRSKPNPGINKQARVMKAADTPAFATPIPRSNKSRTKRKM